MFSGVDEFCLTGPSEKLKEGSFLCSSSQAPPRVVKYKINIYHDSECLVINTGELNMKKIIGNSQDC